VLKPWGISSRTVHVELQRVMLKSQLRISEVRMHMNLQIHAGYVVYPANQIKI
jgi:hypothetical protein